MRSRWDALGRDLDPDGVGERGPLELGDLGRHGGREQVRVALLWQDLENLVDDRSKVEVKQPVGLIEDLIQKVECRRLSKSLSRQLGQPR